MILALLPGGSLFVENELGRSPGSVQDDDPAEISTSARMDHRVDQGSQGRKPDPAGDEDDILSQELLDIESLSKGSADADPVSCFHAMESGGEVADFANHQLECPLCQGGGADGDGRFPDTQEGDLHELARHDAPGPVRRGASPRKGSPEGTSSPLGRARRSRERRCCLKLRPEPRLSLLAFLHLLQKGVHDVDDVDLRRALPDAPSAADAERLPLAVRDVGELPRHAVTDPVMALVTERLPARHPGEVQELAGVPQAHP